MKLLRPNLALANRDGSTWYVSIAGTLKVVHEVEHCGRAYRRSNEKTEGGWAVYKEIERAATETTR